MNKSDVDALFQGLQDADAIFDNLRRLPIFDGGEPGAQKYVLERAIEAVEATFPEGQDVEFDGEFLDRRSAAKQIVREEFISALIKSAEQGGPWNDAAEAFCDIYFQTPVEGMRELHETVGQILGYDFSPKNIHGAIPLQDRMIDQVTNYIRRYAEEHGGVEDALETFITTHAAGVDRRRFAPFQKAIDPLLEEYNEKHGPLATVALIKKICTPPEKSWSIPFSRNLGHTKAYLFSQYEKYALSLENATAQSPQEEIDGIGTLEYLFNQGDLHMGRTKPDLELKARIARIADKFCSSTPWTSDIVTFKQALAANEAIYKMAAGSGQDAIADRRKSLLLPQISIACMQDEISYAEAVKRLTIYGANSTNEAHVSKAADSLSTLFHHSAVKPEAVENVMLSSAGYTVPSEEVTALAKRVKRQMAAQRP